jgi:hypothetical protein
MSPSIEVRTIRGRQGSAASARERDSVSVSVSVRQLDVEEDRCGLRPIGSR